MLDTDAGTRQVPLTETSSISIVVPTYQEVLNIRPLIRAIEKLRADTGRSIDLIIVDDNSRDGTEEIVAELNLDWVNLIVRTQERGLSLAVVRGMEAATGDVVVCMDADLSHDPMYIPQMLHALRSGIPMVVGSRFVAGGSTDDDWGVFRWLNSVVATLLAYPLTSIKDPMSGFFALRRADFLAAKDLNPIGYKIGLELIVKCGFDNVGEIPIHFRDRELGESKLSLKEQLKYIQHLRRLYLYKFANAMYLLQFLAVGASGAVINLFVVSLLRVFGTTAAIALAGGIAVSIVTNFLLNRRFSFSYARFEDIRKQFAGFVLASSVGAAVNFSVSYLAWTSGLSEIPFGLQLSALLGISGGMIFNFLGNRFIVFRKTTYKK